MFRHVVMFRWKPEVDPTAVAQPLEDLRRLPDRIDTLRGFTVGLDAGVNEGNFDIVVVADFEDREGYATYRDHPEHLRVAREQLGPLISERAAVQHEFDGGAA